MNLFRFRKLSPALPSAGRVSVVVPLYNHARFIEDAMRSALDQGGILRELIVVNDGSTDDGFAAVQRLAAQDGRIVAWSQPNRGAHAAINAGVLRATGELVAILNSDDMFLPGRLDALAAALDADPGADLSASGIAFMDADGRAVPNAWYDEALAYLHAAGDMGTALVNANVLMTTSNFMLRRAAVERTGGMAPLRYAHDLDFALRLLALGGRIALLPDVLLRYRIHPGNTIAEAPDRVRAEWALASAAYLALLWDRPGASQPDWAQARAVQAVLERHSLLRAVHLSGLALRRTGLSLDRSSLPNDAAFRANLLEWLQ